MNVKPLLPLPGAKRCGSMAVSIAESPFPLKGKEFL